MREIKFRFWDTEFKKMFKDHEMVMKHITVNEFFSGNNYPLEFMQFTGLQDVIGKDIYEGDICEYVRNEDEELNNVHIFRGVIKFDIGRFYLDAGNKYYTLGAELDAIKIIGNICENPELVC